jgi:hypothetical protein
MSAARMLSATPYSPAVRSAQLATGLRAGAGKAEQLPSWRKAMQVLRFRGIKKIKKEVSETSKLGLPPRNKNSNDKLNSSISIAELGPCPRRPPRTSREARA